MENIEKGVNISLLNFPESTLECILKRLSPMELINMSEVCTSLRDRCRSDHLWDNHVKQKWGRVLGDAAYKEWQWHIETAKEVGNNLNQQINQDGSIGSFTGAWPMLYLGSYLEDCNHLNGSLSNSFMMTLYISLENGKFWFPAQVYPSGGLWFPAQVYGELVVSDALVRYDSKIDTFQARKQSAGWGFLGNDIKWDKLRSPSVDTPSFVRHVSDCFEDLKPGDHIEIQWKISTELPYDWWYAVISHLDSCNENENHCRCHNSETLMVECQQYPHGSSKRRVKLLKNNNGELGENLRGFYGGIRKLHNEEEIEIWTKLLPHHQIP